MPSNPEDLDLSLEVARKTFWPSTAPHGARSCRAKARSECGRRRAVIHSGLSGQDENKNAATSARTVNEAVRIVFSQMGRIEPRNAAVGPQWGPSRAYRQPPRRCNYFLSGPPVRTSAPHLAPHNIAVTGYGVPRNRGQGFDKGKSLRWERDGFRWQVWKRERASHSGRAHLPSPISNLLSPLHG